MCVYENKKKKKTCVLVAGLAVFLSASKNEADQKRQGGVGSKARVARRLDNEGYH